MSGNFPTVSPNLRLETSDCRLDRAVLIEPRLRPAFPQNGSISVIMRGLSGFTDRDGSKSGFDPRRHFHFAPKADVRQRGSHVQKVAKPKSQFNQSVRCGDKLTKRAFLRSDTVSKIQALVSVANSGVTRETPRPDDRGKSRGENTRTPGSAIRSRRRRALSAACWHSSQRATPRSTASDQRR